MLFAGFEGGKYVTLTLLTASVHWQLARHEGNMAEFMS